MQRFETTTDSSVLEEAHALCAFIKDNAAQLKDGNVPGTDFQIRMLAKNRNVVYRIVGRQRWYAKLPRSSTSTLVQRELHGAECLHQRLADNPRFHVPQVVRGCSDIGFLLMSEVPGRYLQSIHYANALRPWSRSRMRDSLQGFHDFGEVLATIHGSAIAADAELAKHAKPSRKTSEACETLRQQTGTRETLAEQMELLADAPRLDFVHGNLRRENILFHNRRLGLIDFETCGRGSRYEDLAFIGCNLAQTALAWVFPWRRVYRAWHELLKGYSRIHPVDYEVYSRFLLKQLIDVLGKAIDGKKPTVSRIPISTARLRRIILNLHQEGFESAFPQVLVAESESVEQ